MMSQIAGMILGAIAPYLMRLAIGGGIVLAAGGGFLTLKVHYQNVGYAQAIAAMATKDKGALDAVREAEGKVDECHARGGAWDVVSGVCG